MATARSRRLAGPDWIQSDTPASTKATAVPPGFMAIIPGMILFQVSISNNQPMSTRPPIRITAAPDARANVREPVRVRGRIGMLMAELGQTHGRSASPDRKPSAPRLQRKREIPSPVDHRERSRNDLAAIHCTEVTANRLRK